MMSKYKYALLTLFVLFLCSTGLSQLSNEQNKALEMEFSKWKGTNEQVDDVCIMGIRI